MGDKESKKNMYRSVNCFSNKSTSYLVICSLFNLFVFYLSSSKVSSMCIFLSAIFSQALVVNQKSEFFDSLMLDYIYCSFYIYITLFFSFVPEHLDYSLGEAHPPPWQLRHRYFERCQVWSANHGRTFSGHSQRYRSEHHL